jgi:hypothetical protein
MLFVFVPDPAKGLGFQNAQQSPLNIYREFSNFIQEERAFVCEGQ